MLIELRADPDFYGVLRPRPGSGRTIKAVGKETALLWFTLQSPGPLPSFAVGNDAEASSGIPQLLLDGVLEVEENGHFLSGAKAAELMAQGRPDMANGSQGRLEMLSSAALTYGESLRLDDPRQLAARLYGFGRQPATPKWTRLLSDGEAVLKFLGADRGTDLRRRLDSDWQEANDQKMAGWLIWSNRKLRTRAQLGGTSCKLYVSPAVEAFPQIFPAVLEVATASVMNFKIGSDSAGLLRPDKMVLYFRDQERLFAVATELASLLKGAAAHGVPFSAEITSDGLLSWGMDPPQSEKLLAWQEAESWRLWVARRLAAAMIAAQNDPHASMRPGQFARERLRHEGVDVDRWTPSASIWQSK